MIVGLDFGTTNSVVALYDKDFSFAMDGGSVLIPSVISYEGGILVGKSVSKMGEAIFSIKRFIGTKRVFAGRSPIEIAKDIMLHLKDVSEKTFGCSVSKCVLTVPAYFGDTERFATRKAAETAGFDVVRLLSEPTAAAIAYSANQAKEGEAYGVYDLGGGTFDVSIVKMHKGVLQVVATSGDTNLGGDDFDEILAKIMLKKVGLSEEASGIGRIAAKEIKEVLSNRGVWEGDFLGRQTAVTLEEFERATHHLVAKTIKCFERALRDAKMRKDVLRGVILVGGATRMPMIEKEIAKIIDCEVKKDIDPDKVVAMGAALQAYNLQQEDSDLLIDVTPLSLKLAMADGSTDTIIERNTPIPAIGKRTFTTQRDGQTGFLLQILQGESEVASECRELESIMLRDIPKMPGGAARLEVVFKLDVDGLLTVSACELVSNRSIAVEIRPSYGLEQSMLEKLISS